MRPLIRSLALMAALTVAASLTPAAMPIPAMAKAAKAASTSAAEKARVDKVPTPKLAWYTCYSDYKCTTVKLPLDYDDPKGAQVEVALLKVPAGDRKHRIGTLFLNPGGPGGSGTDLAYYAPNFLGSDVLDRFDVVGFDPRGVGFSDNVTCFANNAQNEAVLGTINSTPFPDTAAEQRAFVKAYDSHAKACSSTSARLSGSVSTAEVARDMDVMRRAVGDKKLTYLGFSYGSYLGQVYANMFPDRVRALAIVGVLDPRAWAGTEATAATPMGDRVRSADGALKALNEILLRCDLAGGESCEFAPGDPVKNWKLIGDRLRAKPLKFDGEPYGYPEFSGEALSALYYEDGAGYIAELGADLIVLTEPPAKRNAAAAQRAAKRSATASLRKLRTKLARLANPDSPLHGSKLGRANVGFPYDNSLDAFQTIACTDSLDAPNLARMPALAAAADARAPYFGALWAWNMGSCASPSWTVDDEDAYRGPFTRRTAAPVLIVGNYWDPATNYAGAVAASKLLPNSRLLSSDSWGHTAYGTSNCVNAAVDRYLVKRTLPKKGKVCTGDVEPYDGAGTEEFSLQRRIHGPNRPGRP
ncbi:MAG TPA: alpha/beta hydrolase [Mycobacterium sp.]